MKFETKRLTVFPMTYDQVVKYLACDFSLEKELGLKLIDREIPEPLKQVIQNIILPLIANSKNSIYFHSTWLIIDKIEKVIIGSLAFKGKPNDLKEVEIGYGTEPNYQGKGYMTEAIGGLIESLNLNPEIEYLLAETRNENFSSQKVLINNKFIQSAQKEQMTWWKLKLNKL